MGLGRVICVALPFILTVLSLIFLMVAALGGVSNKDLYMFRVNTTDLEINPASLSSIVSRDVDPIHSPQEHDPILPRADNVQTTNITVADLGLYDLYDIAVWGYCTTDANGNIVCSKAKFDWASDYLNTTTLETIGTSTGRKISLPKEVTTALSSFKTATKWTQVAYIIAFIALGLEILLGIFANCTRAMSCLTFLVAAVAAVAVCASAALSTAMAVIIVGAVEGTAKFYGVTAGFNNGFLALIWLSVVFALGAGFFWMFTICCCAPNHNRSKRTNRNSDGEKLLPPTTSYQPIHEENSQYKQQQPPPASQFTPQYAPPRYASGARGDVAYEPYSHRS